MPNDADVDRGFAIMQEMTSPEFVAAARQSIASGGFCSELAKMGAGVAFAGPWSREGLDRRSRSLFTLGVLMGQRHTTELRYHVAIALKNGITVEEIEEMIYQLTVYGGFPTAVQAAHAAREELKAQGAID